MSATACLVLGVMTLVCATLIVQHLCHFVRIMRGKH